MQASHHKQVPGNTESMSHARVAHSGHCSTQCFSSGVHYVTDQLEPSDFPCSWKSEPGTITSDVQRFCSCFCGHEWHCCAQGWIFRPQGLAAQVWRAMCQRNEGSLAAQVMPEYLNASLTGSCLTPRPQQSYRQQMSLLLRTISLQLKRHGFGAVRLPRRCSPASICLSPTGMPSLLLSYTHNGKWLSTSAHPCTLGLVFSDK